jgi:hypothetical protein
MAGVSAAPKEAKGGLSNIMDKLRAKKKLPSAKKSTENKVEKKAETAATTQAPTTTPISEDNSDGTKTDTSKASEMKPNIVNPALLPTKEKPGQVSKSGQEAPTKVSVPEQPSSNPPAVSQPKTKPATPKEPAQAPAPAPATVPAPAAAASTETKPSQTQTTPVPATNTKPEPSPTPEVKKPFDPVDEAAKKLAELDKNDDFSDLLNPPPINVKDLPVISLGEDKKKEDE